MTRGSGPIDDAAQPVPNPDLAAVHRSLVELVGRLDASIGTATTSVQVTAILDEIAEVNARVTALGRQLLSRQTEAISRLSKDVHSAIPDVQRAIDRLDQIKDLVTGVSRFLGVVDKLIDTAKLVV